MKMFSEQATDPIARFVFAHGAGAGKDSEFMQKMAELLLSQHISVTRFDFPYMQKAAELGRRQPPNRMPVLREAFEIILDELDDSLPLFIGGKSMGGRVASMILDNSAAQACICLGYPFHPPGKSEKLRVEHLLTSVKPLLMLQGERDTFGNQSEIESYGLPKNIECIFLKDGDHSFKPRKASGITLEENMIIAAHHLSQFIRKQL